MEHVLLIYQDMIPSAVLCGHAQLQWLAEHAKIEYRHSPTFKVKAEMVSWANVIIFIRGALEADMLIAKKAKKAGKKLVYILDDDLLNVPDYIVSAPFYNRNRTKRMIIELMNTCGCFASPSLKLIEKYGHSFIETVRIEEPALYEKNSSEKNGNKINICFAGSLDRAKDLATLMSDVLRRLNKEYGDRITVTFFGAKPEIVDECGFRYIDYVRNYSDYMAVMSGQNFDIGLAPMILTEFSSCKHYNKFIEYASYGIVGVYSNVYPYIRVVRNRENGMLCENDADAWYEAIALLIEDSELLEKIRKKCLEEAVSVYSLERVSEDYFESICSCDINKTGGRVRSFGLRMFEYKIRHFITRCWNYAVRNLRKVFKRIQCRHAE